MTTQEIKVRGNGGATIFQLIISGIAVIITVVIALVGFTSGIHDRISQNNDRVTEVVTPLYNRVGILEIQQVAIKEWRTETNNKLDHIIEAINELKIKNK